MNAVPLSMKPKERTIRWVVRFWICVLSLFSVCAIQAADKKWNVLLITADDLNGDSMGWMGSKVGATPNLDAFAETCHQFRNCHVSAPICQPSRSALMTGRVPHRNGALGFHPIRSDVTTLTELMGSNGWFTAAINKTAHMMPRTKFNWDLTLEGSGKNPQLMRSQFEQAMKAAADASKPFFINANCTDPHRPFAGSARDESGEETPKGRKATGNQAAAAKIKMFTESEVVVPAFLENIPAVRQEVAQYFSSVRRLDQSFGELITALKAANRMDDTIVVFLADHGMSFPYSKATLYRNGTWTPLLLRVPDMAKRVMNTDMVSSLDIMPTLLDLIGVSKPNDLDGVSWGPLLRGEKQPNRDHVFTHVNTVSSGKSFPGRCVRTEKRAYIWNAWPDGKTQYRVEAMSGLTWNAMAKAAETDARLKPRVQHFLLRCDEEFYDTEKDPDERVNLIADPKYQGEIQQIKKLLVAHMEKTKDPLLAQFTGGKSTATEKPFAKYIPGDKSSGSSLAVVVEENASLAHTSQVFPINRRGRLVPAANVARQVGVTLDNLDAALKLAESSIERVVKLNVYLANGEVLPKVQEALEVRFSNVKPAVCYVVGELPQEGAIVAMDAVAVSSSVSKSIKQVTSDADKPTGIGTAGILPAGPKLYVSGMADTNALLPATRKTLEKLVAAIGHMGTQREDIVQLKVFFQPMSQIDAVRKEVADFFGGKAPSTVFVEWISPNPVVEIELIAAAKGDLSRETNSVSYFTPPGTTDSKVYRRVARVNHGKLIFISGLYGVKSSSGTDQTREILDSLKEVAQQTGSDLEHLVKATYYVTDNEASTALNELRPNYYHPQRAPAASKAKVKGVGLEKTITLDMIAVTK